MTEEILTQLILDNIGFKALIKLLISKNIITKEEMNEAFNNLAPEANTEDVSSYLSNVFDVK